MDGKAVGTVRPRGARSRARALAAGVLGSLVTTACATTGATYGSGVGDSFLEHPPYYAGKGPGSAAVRVGHLPIAYQRGASQAPIFDPGASESMVALLAEMNAHLDALRATVRLVEGGQASAVSHAATRFPPDVRFGCATESGLPDDDCEEREPETRALGRAGQTMQLSVGRPSSEWITWIGPIMHEVGVDHALVITLEVGQYLLRQRGFAGTKEVELGTSHVAKLPWLTSLETPVSVLQLTGALVGPDGKAVRIGAEGLLARRTRIALSSIGAQELITDEDVERLLTARRDDLPGKPLVWKKGLETLVAGLLGRSGDEAP